VLYCPKCPRFKTTESFTNKLGPLKIRFEWQETLEELTAQMFMVQVVVLALAPWRIQNKKDFFSISFALPKKARASTLT
jgi:hypothetical protein